MQLRWISVEVHNANGNTVTGAADSGAKERRLTVSFIFLVISPARHYEFWLKQFS